MPWHGRPPFSPDVEIYKVSIEPVAVVVQQVVTLHAEHHDGRLKSVEQWFHPFDAGLLTSKMSRTVGFG